MVKKVPIPRVVLISSLVAESKFEAFPTNPEMSSAIPFCASRVTCFVIVRDSLPMERIKRMITPVRSVKSPITNKPADIANNKLGKVVINYSFSIVPMVQGVCQDLIASPIDESSSSRYNVACIYVAAHMVAPFFCRRFLMSKQETNSQSPENLVAGTVYVSQTLSDSLEAESIYLKNVSLQTLTAEKVDMENGAVKDLESQSVVMKKSAAGAITTDTLTTTESAIGLARVQNAKFIDTESAILFSGDVETENLDTGLLVARKVRGDRIHTGVLLAREVEGSVESAVDTPRALLIGLVTGLVTGLVMVAGRLFFGRQV